MAFPSKSSIFNRSFHYKPSIFRYHCFWKHPYQTELAIYDPPGKGCFLNHHLQGPVTNPGKYDFVCAKWAWHSCIRDTWNSFLCGEKTDESCCLGPLLPRHPWRLEICLACGDLELVSCQLVDTIIQWNTMDTCKGEPQNAVEKMMNPPKLTQTPVRSWFEVWSRQDGWNISYQRNATHCFFGDLDRFYTLLLVLNTTLDVLIYCSMFNIDILYMNVYFQILFQQTDLNEQGINLEELRT